jgi:CII-binding regulator of phage lambda lysogenization HflD
MAEMKSTIQALKKMDSTSGKSKRNMYSSTEIVLMVEMNIVERNNKIKQLENRIEEIQDKLDIFNANTEIV